MARASTSFLEQLSVFRLPSPSRVTLSPLMSTMRCRTYVPGEIYASTGIPTFMSLGLVSKALSLLFSRNGRMEKPFSLSVTVCPSLISFTISGSSSALENCISLIWILLCCILWQLLCRAGNEGCICLWSRQFSLLCCRYCRRCAYPTSSTSRLAASLQKRLRD